MVKNLPANAGDERDVGSILGLEDPLEKGMATCSSILAWEIPWTEESGRLQSMGYRRVRHNWACTDRNQHSIVSSYTPLKIKGKSSFHLWDLFSCLGEKDQGKALFFPGKAEQVKLESCYLKAECNLRCIHLKKMPSKEWSSPNLLHWSGAIWSIVNLCVSPLKKMLSILYFQMRDQNVERSRTLFQKDWSAMTSPGEIKLEGTGEPSPKQWRPSLAQKGRIRAKAGERKAGRQIFTF